MASDMFIKIGDIKGEASDKTHKDEIDVLSWSWGMSQSGTMHGGGGGGAGKVSVQDLTFSKYVDKASSPLGLACCNGTHIPEAVLTVRKAGKTPLEMLIITMKECLITSISTGGSPEEDRLTESVTLNFAYVEMAYQPQKADGSKDGGAIELKWNIKENVEG